MPKRIPKARQAREASDEGNVVDLDARRTTPLGMKNKPGPKPRPGSMRDLARQNLGVGRGAGSFGDATAEETAVEVAHNAVRPGRRMEVQVRITGKMAELWLGMRSVKDMDNEELSRMQFKGKDGKFSGKPPRNLPAELVREIRSEMVQRATAQFDGTLLDAIEAVRKIATNDDFDPKDRLRAANILIERSLGKVSETLTVQGNADSPVEILLTKIDRGRPPARVVEGTVVHSTVVPTEED